MNKENLKQLEQLKKTLGVTTKAENVVVEHLFKRNLSKNILLRSYGTIREKNGWIEINAITNKHCFLFNIQVVKLENGDEGDLWSKIE